MSSVSLSRLPRASLLASQASPPTTETADRWLIGLRWVAIVGMFATTLIARRLVPALDVGPILAAIAGIAALNVGWRVLTARRAGRRPLVRAQVVIDVAALSIVLWLSGGTGNPFALFLAFHIVLAGLLCGRRFSLGVTVLAVLAAVALSFAPPLPLAGAPMGEAAVRRLAGIVALVNISIFMGFFVFVYVQRLEQLRAESARNEKLAVLGRLVGVMSHELNTPLATILLASKDLVEVGGELGSGEATRLAQTIVDEAERAGEIIGMVRGHVRPDQHPQRLDLAALVRTVALAERARLGYDGALELDLPGPLPIETLGAGVRQILVNVLTNAVQATARLPAPRIAVTLRPRRGRVDVVVEDNGPGITPSLLERLGEPFHTTKADAGGMGLGLYVSTLLAERMGGALTVDTVPGGGTRVTLGLPRAGVPGGAGRGRFAIPGEGP
jgi:two-component system, sensor histidine kinase RegB